MAGYARHPYAAQRGEAVQAADAELAALRVISDIMRRQRGFSFEGYRQNTLLRRVHRRMGLRRIERMSDYVSLLQGDPVEASSLFSDMLIGVTEFFRDPEAWKLLEAEAIRPLLAHKATGEAIRVWVPGVSTGEEAYSLAMAILDERRRTRKKGPIQVFATDTNGEAIEAARAGSFPAGIAAHVPSARLRRYFTEVKDGQRYQVTRELRDCVVFGVQNVLTDPPFTKVDLVSCRNLLIYLAPEVQKRLIQNFHFALRPGGYLFLGSAETVAERDQVFKPVSRRWRIYQRLGTIGREHPEFGRPAQDARAMAEAPHGALVPARPMNPTAIAQTMILERFAPASLLVNGRREVLYYAGPTDRYLRQPRGAPSNELLALARDGLRATLSGALRRSLSSDASLVALGGSVKRNGGFVPVKITVTPVAGTGADADGRLVLVVFQDEPKAAPRRGRGKEAAPPPLVRQLEEELRATRDDLQTTIDRLENSNEELRVSHEEVVAGNEELQSMNEELESSKEELQSLNEELNAVNQQLQTKIGEVETANNDLTNLLESSDIATACLDRSLRIKWFTPAAREVLKMIPTDVGRPISDLGSALAGESLASDAHTVLERLSPVETEARAENGRSYVRRTLPYRTAEHKIGGVVVNFSDITDTRRAAALALEASQERGKALEDRVAVADVQLRALSAELSLAEEREREAIARDLHDNLAQVLHVAKLKLAAFAKAPGDEAARAIVKELDTLVTHAEMSVRSLIFQLNPPVLSELGLVPALHWLSEEMQRSYGLAVEVREGDAPKPLGRTTRLVVYRAVRELLINVAKHAEIGHALVDVNKSGDTMIVVVRDTGKGFDPAVAMGPGRKGLGLLSVRERIGFIGGKAEIRSAPGRGTEVTLTVPLQAATEPAKEQSG
jgi:two-component system CheB/CheR fusion protein